MSEQLLDKARETFQSGDFARVEKICRKVLKRAPDDLDAKYLLTLSLFRRQKYKGAEKLLEEILRVDKGNVVAQNSLGLIYNETGRFRKASKVLEKALEAAPGDVDVLSNLAAAYRGLKDYTLSTQYYEKAIALAPNRHELYQNYGSLLLECHEYKDAVVQYKKSLSISPGYLKAVTNLAIAQAQLKEFEEAAKQYRYALTLEQSQAPEVRIEIICGLADLFVSEGNHEEAQGCLNQASEIDPESPRLITAMANYYSSVNDKAKLAEVYETGIRLFDDPFIRSSRIMLNMYEYPFPRERVATLTREFGKVYEKDVKPKFIGKPEPVTEARSLRVGFLSRDARSHSVGYFLSSLFTEIDRSAFDLFVYDDAPKNDFVSEQLKELCFKWTRIKDVKDEVVAQTIFEDELDVLIDLGGHTVSHRLAVMMMKPCGRQISWLGYPCTTGLKTMDYILGDPITLPEAEEDFYTEQALRMPATNICYEPPEAALQIAVRSSPVKFNGHITFGCFNNLAKVNAAVIETWCELMGEVPGSRLILKDIRLNSRQVCDDLLQQFERGGVSAERVEFAGYLSHTEHFGLYHSVDIGLDPFPYNGTTTTCEALFMGVPTLTLKSGGSMTCKYGELINSLVGLDEFIADDRPDYIEKGRRLAGDVEALSGVRATCRARMLDSPLCDKAEFARSFENVIRSIVNP